MKTLTDNFFVREHYAKQSVLFKKALYVFVLLKCVLWSLSYPVLFGEHAAAITGPLGATGPIRSLAYLLYASANAYTGWLFIGGCILISFVSLFKRNLYLVTDLILWFLLVNIHHKVYPTLTGGDYLLNQLALFNIFILQKNNATKNWIYEIRNCLHNFACYALMLQICFVYFISGYAKLRDEDWISGNAISTILNVEHYNLLRIQFSEELSNSMNYLIMFYQLLFPIVIWFRHLKKPLLIFGVLFHLYVAFGMGLLGFGIIMIIPYIYFWPVKSKN